MQPYNSSLMSSSHQQNNNMFKPSLKRQAPAQSKQPYSHAMLHPFTEDQEELKESHRYPSPVIIPLSLFTNKVSPQKQPVFNPLNYAWNKYPQSIQEMLSSQTDEPIARDMGVHGDILWSFNGLEVILWNQSQNMEKRYELPQRSEIIAFGELQCSALHFKSSNPIIMVVGIENYIHLFGINRQTLEYDDFKVCYRLNNSSFVQKIIFHQKNQIVVVSDTGQHYSFDFREELKVNRPFGGFMQKTLPYIPLLYPKKQLFYENTVVSGDYLCSLVREEKKISWLTIKAKQLMNSLTNSANNEEWIKELRKIEIYQIDREKNEIMQVNILTEEQIINKLRKACKFKEDAARFEIVCIGLKKGSQNVLEISLKAGYFVYLDLESQTLDGQFMAIPSHNAIGTTGFFLQKKITINHEQDQNISIISSLGTDSLTLTQNSLLFFNENTIEVVKSGEMSGKLVEMKSNVLQNRRWLLLTKNGFFMISRLTPREMIIGFIYQREQIKNPVNVSKKYTNQYNYQLLVETLGSSIGEQNMVQSLIKGQLEGIKTVELSRQIMNFIVNDLEGEPNVHIRDWNYQLTTPKEKSKRRNQTLQVTSDIREELWKIIISHSNKAGKNQPEDLIQTKRTAGAYWLALKDLFRKITLPLMSVQPKNVKANRKKINLAQEQLDRIAQFFKEKKKREDFLASELYIMRKETKEEKQDLNAFFKRKKVEQISRKKLEESIETQNTDTSDSKKVTQSSTSLEKDILEAMEKMKVIIEVIMHLSEVQQAEQMPFFALILKSKEAQRVVKQKLIKQTSNRSKLEQFDRVVPELSLRKDIQMLKWLQEHQKFKRLGMFDLEIISNWMSSPYIEQVLKVLEDDRSQQVEFMIQFWDRTSDELTKLAKLEDLELKFPTLYSKDSKILMKENKQFLAKQQKTIKATLQKLISETVENYIHCSEESYQKAEKTLNQVILIITSHDEHDMNQFMQGELKKAKINEKILYFKKHLKKKVKEITIEDRLMNKHLTRKVSTYIHPLVSFTS